MIRVFRDNILNIIYFQNTGVTEQFAGNIKAIERDGKIDIIRVNNAGKFELYQKSWDVFANKDGVLLGDSLLATINELNKIFAQPTGVGNVPDPEILNDEPVRFPILEYSTIQILTNPESNVLFYDAAGLPLGLYINNATGEIFGIPQEIGDFDVNVTVLNSKKSVTKILKIEVFKVKYNLKSVLFKDNFDILRGQSSNTLDDFFGARQSFSLCLWMKSLSSKDEEQIILSKWHNNNGIKLSLTNNGSVLDFLLQDDGGGFFQTRTLPNALLQEVDRWNFISIIYDIDANKKDPIDIYINGEQQQQQFFRNNWQTSAHSTLFTKDGRYVLDVADKRSQQLDFSGLYIQTDIRMEIRDLNLHRRGGNKNVYLRQDGLYSLVYDSTRRSWIFYEGDASQFVNMSVHYTGHNLFVFQANIHVVMIETLLILEVDV